MKLESQTRHRQAGKKISNPTSRKKVYDLYFFDIYRKSLFRNISLFMDAYLSTVART